MNTWYKLLWICCLLKQIYGDTCLWSPWSNWTPNCDTVVTQSRGMLDMVDKNVIQSRVFLYMADKRVIQSRERQYNLTYSPDSIYFPMAKLVCQKKSIQQRVCQRLYYKAAAVSGK